MFILMFIVCICFQLIVCFKILGCRFKDIWRSLENDISMHSGEILDLNIKKINKNLKNKNMEHTVCQCHRSKSI